MDKKTLIDILLYFLSDRNDKINRTKLDRISISDWNSLIQQLHIYDIAPLFYYRLKNFSKSICVPTEIMQRLQQIYFHSAAKNMLLYNDFAEVIKKLKSEGIDVVALKGLHLSKLIYSDIALRPMSDMDILVRRDDLSRVEKKLIEMGYGPTERPGIKEQCAMHHHLIPFTKPGKASIEVHWTITPPTDPFKIDIDDIWQRTKEAKIADVSVLVLSPEDLLLHLCLHVSFQHKFRMFEIKNIYDISETFRHYGNEIDWGRIISTAKEYEISKFVYCTLFLTRKILGTEIPLNILNALKGDIDIQILGILQDYILFRSDFEIPEAFRKIKETKRFTNKIKFLFQRFFPPIKYLRKKYALIPDSKTVYIYYIFHLLEILIRGTLLMTHIIIGTKKARLLLETEKKKKFIEKWLYCQSYRL